MYIYISHTIIFVHICIIHDTYIQMYTYGITVHVLHSSPQKETAIPASHLSQQKYQATTLRLAAWETWKRPYNSRSRGEATPVTHWFIRPFTGSVCNSIYRDPLNSPCCFLRFTNTLERGTSLGPGRENLEDLFQCRKGRISFNHPFHRNPIKSPKWWALLLQHFNPRHGKSFLNSESGIRSPAFLRLTTCSLCHRPLVVEKMDHEKWSSIWSASSEKGCESIWKKIPDTPSTQCILGNVIALGTPKNLLLDSSCLPGESTRPQSHEGCCLTRTQAERKCRFKWWIVTDRIVCYKDLFQAEVWLAMLGIGFHATSKRWAFQVDGSCEEVAACALKLTTFPASANI